MSIQPPRTPVLGPRSLLATTGGCAVAGLAAVLLLTRFHAGPVVLAVALRSAALLCMGLAWRSAFVARGASLCRVGGCARYGIGSLLNTLLPARLGSALRVTAFASALGRGAAPTARTLLWIGATRSALVAAPLVVLGALGSVPLWSPAIPVGTAALLTGAATIRRRRPRVDAPLVAATGRLGGWLAASIVLHARAVAVLLAIAGVRSPLAAALVVMVAVETSSALVPTPGSVGVAGGAAALALVGSGVHPAVALPAALAVHLTETASSLVVGGASLLVLGLRKEIHRDEVLASALRAPRAHAMERWAALDSRARRPLRPVWLRRPLYHRPHRQARRAMGSPGWGEPHLTASRMPAYLAEIAQEAARARSQYDLLVVPGAELTYDDCDPRHGAHAVAVGLRSFVSVDDSLVPALESARHQGAALVAAHPYSIAAAATAHRATAGWAAGWKTLRHHVDRVELVNRTELFGWIAQAGVPVVANGDFHRPEHLPTWKTLLPCEKDERALVDYLRSDRPAYLVDLSGERRPQAA